MKTKRRRSDREIAAVARRAVEMTVYWADVEIVDDVVTGRLVVRPCTD